MTDLTELTDEPEVIEGDAEANRWTNYGKDRVYLNDNDFSGEYDAYIDLETGEFVCDYSSDFQMDIEDGTATITKHWVGGGEEHSEVVVIVRLFETEDDEEENEAEGQDSDDERDLEAVSPETAAEDYQWLYEGRRYRGYKFDRDRYEGENTWGVHQSAGPGVLWHETTVERVGDGEYRAACSCPANKKQGECSHVHAVVARIEDAVAVEGR